MLWRWLVYQLSCSEFGDQSIRGDVWMNKLFHSTVLNLLLRAQNHPLNCSSFFVFSSIYSIFSLLLIKKIIIIKKNKNKKIKVLNWYLWILLCLAGRFGGGLEEVSRSSWWESSGFSALSMPGKFDYAIFLLLLIGQSDYFSSVTFNFSFR